MSKHYLRKRGNGALDNIEKSFRGRVSPRAFNAMCLYNGGDVDALTFVTLDLEKVFRPHERGCVLDMRGYDNLTLLQYAVSHMLETLS